MRELEEDRAEAPGRLERAKRGHEHLLDALQRVGREVLAIEALLFRRQLLAHLLRQPAGADRVMGQERERLDVEDEVRRRALDPERGVALRGKRVVGRVDLDQGNRSE